MTREHDGRWVFSDSDEQWPVDCSFETKEQATAAARDAGAGYVGRAVAATAKRLFGTRELLTLLELIDEDAGEEWGTDDSLIALRTCNEQALLADLRAAFDRHGTFAEWYRIEATEKVEAVQQ